MVDTAGGRKGEAIRRLLEQHPDWPKDRIAEKAGSSLGRVYEVNRALKAEAQAAARGSDERIGMVVTAEAVAGVDVQDELLALQTRAKELLAMHVDGDIDGDALQYALDRLNRRRKALENVNRNGKRRRRTD